MPPKTKSKSKSKSKNMINSRYKKIKNKNVVNVHIHKPHRAEVERRTVVRDTFQPRLPSYYPFVNARPTPLQTPGNVYIHGDTLTKNTPPPSALNTHTKCTKWSTNSCTTYSPSQVPPLGQTRGSSAKV